MCFYTAFIPQPDILYLIVSIPVAAVQKVRYDPATYAEEDCFKRTENVEVVSLSGSNAVLLWTMLFM